MFQVINATPHPVHVLVHVLPGQVRHLVTGEHGSYATPQVETPDGQAWEIPPSGYRLAAQAYTAGPKLGCAVQFAPTGEALAEVAAIREHLYGCQGVANVVISSEISARAIGDINDGVLGVVVVWPVLAERSLRMPPGERWASHLAAVQVPVRNAAGEVVGEEPYWRHRP